MTCTKNIEKKVQVYHILAIQRVGSSSYFSGQSGSPSQIKSKDKHWPGVLQGQGELSGHPFPETSSRLNENFNKILLKLLKNKILK